jgi:hypothetical protein
VLGTCECGNEHSGLIKRGEFRSYKPVSFSRRTPLHGVSTRSHNDPFLRTCHRR